MWSKCSTQFINLSAWNTYWMITDRNFEKEYDNWFILVQEILPSFSIIHPPTTFLLSAPLASSITTNDVCSCKNQKPTNPLRFWSDRKIIIISNTSSSLPCCPEGKDPFYCEIPFCFCLSDCLQMLPRSGLFLGQPVTLMKSTSIRSGRLVQKLDFSILLSPFYQRQAFFELFKNFREIIFTSNESTTRSKLKTSIVWINFSIKIIDKIFKDRHFKWERKKLYKLSWVW